MTVVISENASTVVAKGSFIDPHFQVEKNAAEEAIIGNTRKKRHGRNVAYED
ncbi:MAG: hypothetical protein NTV00_06910 [Methylococcales bacterium]|nr:hypothetical protein [Methylococcales bacterium]